MTGRILIVDDVATNRIVMKGRLGLAFHETLLAEDGASALRMVRDHAPDLVLLDLDLPDIGGGEVLSRLRADPRHRDLPVIVYTARATPELRLSALRAGADDVMSKSADPALLLARIRALLRRREPGSDLGFDQAGLQEMAEPFDWPGTIAITSARAETATALRARLLPVLPHALMIRDHAVLLTSAAADIATVTPPDAYVIDATEGPDEASALLSELRSGTTSREAGIVVIAPDSRLAALAHDLGADEAVLPDTPAEEIALRMETLLRRTRAAANRRASLHDQARLAMTDPLTGLHNRRFALRRLGEISASAVGTGHGFTVLLADLDRFKQVNDRYGHVAGDAVLADVAARLHDQMQPGDLLARIGGEEFLIALPTATRREGEDRARALCDSVSRTPVTLRDGRSVHVTLSIGLAQATPGSLPERMIENADRALLAAKTQGRNRVIVGGSAA